MDGDSSKESHMSLIGLLILLVIAGIALVLIPLDAKIKQIIYIVIAVAIVVWLLNEFSPGLLT
jgi:hypothetical protein